MSRGKGKGEMMSGFRELSLQDFLGRLASPTPTPGGGTAAAVAAAVAAALLAMATSISLRKNPGDRELEETRLRAEGLRRALLELADEDAAAYEAVMEAYRLPKGSEEERELRKAKVQEALRSAAEVPLRTAELSLEAWELATGIVKRVRSAVISDLLVAIRLAQAGVHAALYNVDINLASLRDEAAEALAKRRRALTDRLEELEKEIPLAEARLRGK